MAAFRAFFTAPVWDHVLVLVTGTILAPGKRTVSAALRIMGLGSAAGCARYHHVLSQARWSSHAVARKLPAMIIEAFLPNGPIVIEMDDTIERRWGQKIAAMQPPAKRAFHNLDAQLTPRRVAPVLHALGLPRERRGRKLASIL